MNIQPFDNLHLSIPFNGDPDLPMKLIKSSFRQHISEVYFAGNPCIIPSGRRPKIKYFINRNTPSTLFNDVEYDNCLIKMLHLFDAHLVKCNLLLNFNLPITPEMIKYIDRLVDNGTSAITVGSIDVLNKVYKRYRNNLDIQNSVYIPANSIKQLFELVESGINILLIPPDFNHDMNFIKEIYNKLLSRNIRLKIVVNEGCVKNCHYRLEHLNDAQNYPVQLAAEDYLNNPKELRTLSNPCRCYLGEVGIGNTNYIHPNDISKYAAINPILKIVGRSFSSDIILKICQSYVNGSYKGDLRVLVENFKHAVSPVEHKPNELAFF